MIWQARNRLETTPSEAGSTAPSHETFGKHLESLTSVIPRTNTDMLLTRSTPEARMIFRSKRHLSGGEPGRHCTGFPLTRHQSPRLRLNLLTVLNLLSRSGQPAAARQLIALSL